MTSAIRFSLAVIEGLPPGQQFDLSDSTIIGREAASAGGVAIDASTLSRRHAQIAIEGDRCWIADLNSTNGPFLNGRQLSGKPEPQQTGDRIQPGPTFVLLLQGASPAVEAAAQPGKDPVPATIMGDDLACARPMPPPQLLIDLPGEPLRTLTLTGPVFTLYSNGHKLGEIRVDQAPTVPDLPQPPSTPVDSADPAAAAEYAKQMQAYGERVGQMRATFQPMLGALQSHETNFERGFVAMVALSESGVTRCHFDNTWLWLIGE
ncbi:MAG: FHA domain-containing protein [Anaerolineales bacterium]|nr:FHA domain-containing protein [Anaerolineales bacterium]